MPTWLKMSFCGNDFDFYLKTVMSEYGAKNDPGTTKLVKCNSVECGKIICGCCVSSKCHKPHKLRLAVMP